MDHLKSCVSCCRRNLTGTIPCDLQRLAGLTTLWLQDNQLTGQLIDLTGLSSLVSLRLATNYFNGSIPAGYGSVTGRSFNFSVFNNPVRVAGSRGL